jgi:ribonucleoside-triphosphate reductase
MAGKYGIPYFSNFINSDMNPEDARSMCCRLRLDKRELQRRGGGLFGANPLTGSIGVVTINLPRLGYKSSSRGSLLSSLDALVDMAIESLELKRAAIEKFTDENLYPYSKFYLRDVKARTGGYWSNHFNTIGIIGLNEMLLNFEPISADITSKEGRAFGLEVMNHLREYILAKQIEKDSLINLEATPAEGTSFRLAESDKKLYKYIKSASSGDSAYYTNSSQLPMHLSLDMFDALEAQDEFQTKYTGGTVFHLYLGEEVSDITTIKSLVKKVAYRYKMPYFTLSPVFSVCPNHGYISGTEELCPNCGGETEVYARVVGYYRPTRNWNKGKKAELVDRINFKI